MSEPDDFDARFSLANERTYLALIRTSLALLAGGVAAAKAIEFHHDALRWVVAGPPLAMGTFLAARAPQRMRAYDRAMRAGHVLPVGRQPQILAAALALYGVIVLLAVALDG